MLIPNKYEETEGYAFNSIPVVPNGSPLPGNSGVNPVKLLKMKGFCANP